MHGLDIEVETVPQAYRKVLAALRVHGEVIACQQRPTMEVIGARIQIMNPLLNVVTDPLRKFNYRYLLGEMMWNLCPRSDTALLKELNKGIHKFVADQPEGTRDHAAWAYGPHIFPHLDAVLKDLARVNTTRRAVLRPGRDTVPGVEGRGTPPCLEIVQFFIRQSQVHCVVYMRSNDAFLGMPYDMFTYTTWQRAVAVALGLGVGTYTHDVGSLHLYMHDLDRAAEAAESDDEPGQMLWAPDMREAASGDLNDDLDMALSQLKGHTVVQPGGWKAKSWAPALEIVARAYPQDDAAGEPTMTALRKHGIGVNW